MNRVRLGLGDEEKLNLLQVGKMKSVLEMDRDDACLWAVCSKIVKLVKVLDFMCVLPNRKWKQGERTVIKGISTPPTPHPVLQAGTLSGPLWLSQASMLRITL